MSFPSLPLCAQPTAWNTLLYTSLPLSCFQDQLCCHILHKAFPLWWCRGNQNRVSPFSIAWLDSYTTDTKVIGGLISCSNTWSTNHCGKWLLRSRGLFIKGSSSASWVYMSLPGQGHLVLCSHKVEIINELRLWHPSCLQTLPVISKERVRPTENYNVGITHLEEKRSTFSTAPPPWPSLNSCSLPLLTTHGDISVPQLTWLLHSSIWAVSSHQID